MHLKYLPLAAVVLMNQVLHAGYVEEVLRDEPIAYWRLGEGDFEDELIDATGNVDPGEYLGGAGLEPGFPGAIVGDDDTSVQFATTTGFACGDCGVGQVPVGGVLDLGTLGNVSMTLEAWFQILPSVNDALPPSHFNRIFHYNNGDDGQYAFGIVGDNSAGFPGQRTVFGGIGSGLEDGQGDQGIILAAEADAIPPSDDPVWHHFVAHLEDEDVRLFLDGEELMDLDDSDPIFWQAPQATIGGRVQNSGAIVHPFPGLIDELAIYKTLLPPARIEAHYKAGLGMGTVLGDYNDNGELDSGDLDLQAEAIVGGTHPSEFDLTADGLVNFADRQNWVSELKNTWLGDSNLDGEFNSADLVLVFAGGKYETNETADWSQGDWDGNTNFDSSDLVASFADGGYEQGPRLDANVVPEPTSSLLLVAGLFGIVIRRQRVAR